jgi:hypothetical protein
MLELPNSRKIKGWTSSTMAVCAEKSDVIRILKQLLSGDGLALRGMPAPLVLSGAF